jgi:chromosome partitioning related protein ParA
VKVVSIASTKGGVGKTTTAANLGGFAADAGLRVLLADIDNQPALSSYFGLTWKAPGGVYELLALNQSNAEQVISHTEILNLDIILSNDRHGNLPALLLSAPDGRLRLRHLIERFSRDYDLLLIDTQGARTVLLEMAVLCSDVVLSPITPELLAARELQRGTLQLMEDVRPFEHWGIRVPALSVLLNRVNAVSSNTRLIASTVRDVFGQRPDIVVLRTQVPALESYQRAATAGLPVHRIERTTPRGRIAPAALETIRALATELFPEWSERFALVERARCAKSHAETQLRSST